MKRFGDAIESALGRFLAAHHFRLSEEHYHWSDFGSSYVVYARRNLKLQFIDDRKENWIRCEVKGGWAADWLDIQPLLPQQEQNYFRSATIEQIAIVISENLEVIAERLKTGESS